MKKLYLIIGALIGLGLVLAVLLREGFVSFRSSEYPLPASKLANWDEVFRQPGRFKLEPWQTGVGITKSRNQNLDQDQVRSQHYPDDSKTFPMWAYYLHHPTWGAMLIDTGLDKSFSSPGHGNYVPTARLYTRLIGSSHQQEAGQSLNEHLALAPVQPATVFLTHLHFDHTAGLPALSGQEQIVLGRGQEDFANRVLSGRYFARFSRIREIDIEKGKPMPPFAKAADLMGDGSLWAVKTDGHTPGHLSYLVMTQTGPALLTGDACMYYDALERGIAPFAQYAGDRAKARESLKQIREFLRLYPQVKVFVGHDDMK